MANYQTIKTNKKITRKLSIAVGLLACGASIIAGWGETWGFGPVATQIAQSALQVAGAIETFFLGVTIQKNLAEKENNEKEKK